MAIPSPGLGCFGVAEVSVAALLNLLFFANRSSDVAYQVQHPLQPSSEVEMYDAMWNF